MVDRERNHTIGLNKVEIALTSPEIARASCSDFFMAIRFGTSSPKINVKYDKINVITTTESVFSVERGIPIPRPMRNSTSGSEKLSAANALPRKPDKVMATWIVERNFDGSLVR